MEPASSLTSSSSYFAQPLTSSSQLLSSSSSSSSPVSSLLSSSQSPLSSSSSYSPLSSFSALSLQESTPSHQFICPEALNIPSDFSTILTQARKSFNEVSLARRNLSAKIYSLSAPSDKVDEMHKVWKSEADGLREKLKGCTAKLDELYKYVPFLEESSIVAAFSAIESIRLSLPLLKEQIDNCYNLANSPLYKKAHKLCKEAIRNCEVIDKSKGAQSTFQQCEKLFTATLATIVQQREEIKRSTQQKSHAGVTDNHVERQTLECHIDTLELFRHRMSHILGGTEQDTTLLKKITSAINSNPLKKTPVPPSLLHLDLPDDAKPSEGRTLLSSYTDSFKKTPLPAELNFKQITNSFTGWFTIQIIYSSIKDKVKNLKAIAHGVQTVENDLKSTIEEIVQAKLIDNTELKKRFDKFSGALDYLRYSLQEEKKLLLSNSKEADVHAGIYYADRLSKALSELRQEISLFKALVADGPLETVSTMQTLKIYLTDRKTGLQSPLNHVSEIHALFQAAKKAIHATYLPRISDRTVTHFINDCSETCYKVIAYVGNKTLSSGLSEQDVFNAIINQSSLDVLDTEPVPEGVSRLTKLPTSLKAFIARECTRNLFFSCQSPQHSTKLDIILLLLRSLPQYQNCFEETMKDQKFAELVLTYNQSAAALTHTPFFTEILQVFTLTSNILKESTNKYLPVFQYSQACFHYYNSKKQPQVHLAGDETTQQQELQQACQLIIKSAYNRLDEARKKHDFPAFDSEYLLHLDQLTNEESPSFISLLFSILTSCLYNSGEEQQLATSKLRAYFGSKGNSQKMPPQLAQVRYLLALLVLQVKLENNVALWPFEEHILKELLKTVLTNTPLESTFQKLLKPCQLEHLLYMLVTTPSYESEIKAEIESSRGKKEGAEWYQTWKRGMHYYDSFVKKRDEKWLKWLSELLNQSSETPLPPPYNEPLNRCLAEMKK